MKRCELCDRAARMYCESDQASLCWDCDAKVHSANFLVERHPRVLLCRRCQAPTPWRATGSRLSPIVSACDRCTVIDKASPAGEEQDEGEVDVKKAAMYEGEQEDCQVVPRRPTPPPPASSSSGEESSSPSSGKSSSNSLKRIRKDDDLGSENDRSRPFYQRRRGRHGMFIQAPFSSRFSADENAIPTAASFRRTNNHRISYAQSNAVLSVDSCDTGSRA